MNLFEDGLMFLPRFISDDELTNLRKEVKNIFSKNIINGPGYAVCLSSFVQEITWPVSKIKSINMMEKAVSIMKHLDSFPELKAKKFKLAHVAVYREKDNPTPLHWHSDGRNKNLIRAQVCITGGQRDSGAFQYIKKSIQLEGLTYLPPKGYVEAHQADVQTCAEANGTLYLFNTYGLHNKTVCTSERISIMFDFLPEEYIKENPSDVSSNLVLSVDNLTPEVIAYLERFQLNRPVNTPPSPNTMDNYKYNLKLGGLTRKFTLVSKIKKFVRSLFSKPAEAKYQ